VILQLLLLSLDIEHLPQEMRNRFTEMREMDLQVESMYFIVHQIYIYIS
jgi:hypothetical protein